MRDDLVRNNRWFQWASGMDHDQAEPSRVLLPGRVDPPPDLPSPTTNRAHLLATFRTSDETSEVAPRRGAIVVGCTAIVPRLPEGEDDDWWDLEDEYERYPLLAELESKRHDSRTDRARTSANRRRLWAASTKSPEARRSLASLPC